MLSIKSNMMATSAARHLGKSYDSLSSSVERLSSGLRINSAKDDAAGMAVRELIRADVATLRQGQRNAADAISMLQTAEGALGAVDDILVRMKALAEQASTDSYSAAQRSLMNQEFTELGKEISRIAETTDFNDIKLLNSTSNYEIHVGSTDASVDNKISITAEKMDGGTLGLTGSKEYSVFNTTVGATDATLATVTGTGTGDLTYTFGLDVKADGSTPMGTITLDAFANDEVITLDSLVSAINVKSQEAQTGYNMASFHYDSSGGTYTLKLTAYSNGDLTDLVVGGGVTTTSANLETSADYTDTQGTSTGQAIDTTTSAITALATVDAAIETKDTYRAKLGYMINRLEAATTVIGIQAENLETAESRISDVDVAIEMAQMTRNQVLAQAGISMLAQANSMPQMALKLLG